jgi:hypothetical protein
VADAAVALGDHFLFGSSGLAAADGHPIVQVPAGTVFEVPLGTSFFGTAFSEPTLIKLTGTKLQHCANDGKVSNLRCEAIQYLGKCLRETTDEIARLQA